MLISIDPKGCPTQLQPEKPTQGVQVDSRLLGDGLGLILGWAIIGATAI